MKTHNPFKLDNLKRYVAAIVLSLFFTACDDTGVLPIFQPSYDLELGQQTDAQIRADGATFPMLNNAAANKYLQDIVDKIVTAPEIKYEDVFVYKVEIINSDVINAFATPGGYIYVYTGLIKYIESEAEMAAVLAHEIAHADRRHSVNQMQAQMGVGVLVDMFLNNDQSKIISLATDIVTKFAFMKYGRDDETESDEYSFKYLKSTNQWYPGGGKYFFQRMVDQKAAGGTGSTIIDEFLSTHPADENRVKSIEKLLKDNNTPEPTEETLGKAKYTAFKNSI